MGFLKPTFFLLAVNLLTHSVTGREVINCFVSNFDEAEVTFTYNQQGEIGDLQLAVEFGGQAVTEALTLDETDPTDPELTDNYVIAGSCNDAFRFCKAHVGILYNYDVRAEIAKANGDVTLKIQTTSQATTAAVCKIDGRNLDILAPQNALEGQADTDDLGMGTVYGTSDVFSFPIGGEINGFIPADSAAVTGIQFSYTSGEKQLIGSDGTFGSLVEFTASEVKTVNITSEPSTGQFCGLALKNPADEELASYDLCQESSPTVDTVTIEAGNRLVGFMQYGAVKLVPVQYQRLSPRVMYYKRQDTSPQNLQIFWTSFFATQSLTYDATYMVGLSSTDGTIQRGIDSQVSISGVSATDPSSGTFDVNQADITCGCYDVQLTFASTVVTGDSFQYSGDEVFKAWTAGFTDNLLSYGSNTGSQFTGSAFITHSVDSGKCPELYPRFVATGNNNEMYIDGWIGAKPANQLIPTSVTPITDPIIQVDVHGSETDSVATVTGLAFTLAGETTPTINVGDTVSGVLDSLVAPDNHYLKYIIGQADSSDANILRGISAMFGQPKGPCYVLTLPAEEYTSGLTNGDMRKVYWYAPVDYVKVVADITGKFVADPSENLKAEIVPIGGATEFDRGQVHEANLYHLKPNTAYSFTLTGTAAAALDSAAAPGTPVQFTTESGVSLVCTNGPSTPLTFTNLIDWSAIPEAEIRYEESTEVTGGGSAVGDATNAQSAQSFPADTYFHYLSGQSVTHPTFEEFRGYPTKVYVYNVGSCIRGLALEFSFSNTDPQKVFLVGDETSTSSMTLAEESFSERVTAIGASFADEASGYCLMAISFTVVGGNTPSCLGAAGQTCDVSTTAPTDSYLSSLSVSIDATSSVVAFTPRWVSVDVPDLESTAGATCPVTYTPTLGDIRASKFELTYNLQASQTQCGTYSAIDGTSHVLTYRNSVKRTRDSSSSTIEGTGVTISRSSAWQVDTTCTYTAENAVESYFETQGEPLYKATSLNAIQFTMSLYRDAQFSQAYSDSNVPTLNLGDTAYMDTTITTPNLDNYVVKNFECYATESSDPNDKTNYYSLTLNDGCPSDDSFVWDSAHSTAERDAFHFESFGWVKDNTVSIDTVYIHCKVRACPTTPAGADSTCTARGTTCGNKRARRDVTGLLPEGVHEKTITLDTPIFVKRRNVQSLSINRDPVVMTENRSLLVATLFGQFALVTFICLMVIGYRVHSMRKGYYLHKKERDETVSN